MDKELYEYLIKQLGEHEIYLEHDTGDVLIESKKYDFYYYFEEEEFNTIGIANDIKDEIENRGSLYSDAWHSGTALVYAAIRSYKIQLAMKGNG